MAKAMGNPPNPKAGAPVLDPTIGTVSGGNDIVSGEIPLEIGNAGFKTTKVLQRPLAQGTPTSGPFRR